MDLGRKTPETRREPLSRGGTYGGGPGYDPPPPDGVWKETTVKHKVNPPGSTKPARRERRRRNRKKRAAQRFARLQQSWWFGPEFVREPEDAPCFLGPALGRNAVYVLVDPRTSSVAYVGKTTCSDRRFWQHITWPHNASLRKVATRSQVRGQVSSHDHHGLCRRRLGGLRAGVDCVLP
jgi:hypothetical protein